MYFFNRPPYLPLQYIAYQTTQIPNTHRFLAQRSNLPPVDSTLLYESANETKKLMKDANLVIEKLASSKDFGTQIMEAAQRSDNKQVQNLIHTTGITSKVDVYFNPDGIRLEFKSSVRNMECCTLLVSLRWR